MRANFLTKVRQEGIDDQNQAVEYVMANGGEPCRDVLRAARPSEPLILASYCPFTKAGPYKEYGPVFVLADQGDEHFDTTKLPLPTGSELDYLRDVFVLRADCVRERIVDAKLVTPEQAHTVLNAFFSNNKVLFVLARFASHGCCSFRVQRAECQTLPA